jgi:MarR family transcriptional regulator, organic hydroperoxide resistance regulator
MANTDTICARLRHSWLGVARMYNAEALQHDLTTTVGFILLRIDSKEGVPSTKIGPLLGMEATSLTRTLSQLEEKGYIRRKKDTRDARRVMITLTEKGKQKRDIARKTVKAFNEEIRKRVDEKHLTTFLNVLQDINGLAIEMNFTSKTKA